jgi:glutathione S-transferase
MILYFAPGACSLADHIALNEAGLAYDLAEVDLKTHKTKDGGDYARINPKGYVPALALDEGGVLTENIAILAWVADQSPALAPGGPMGRYRQLEVLAYISSEIHKAFKPFFKPNASEADKAEAAKTITRRLDYLGRGLDGGYLLGGQAGVADAYLFVMLTWAKRNGLALADPLPAYFERMIQRPAVGRALKEEGLA